MHNEYNLKPINRKSGGAVQQKLQDDSQLLSRQLIKGAPPGTSNERNEPLSDRSWNAPLLRRSDPISFSWTPPPLLRTVFRHVPGQKHVSLKLTDSDRQWTHSVRDRQHDVDRQGFTENTGLQTLTDEPLSYWPCGDSISTKPELSETTYCRYRDLIGRKSPGICPF